MTTPTLINLPPPPSDPVTPSDMGPGTPNSGTTSLSALSTTAIKDGHTGQPLPHGRHSHHSPSTSLTSTTLEAERADRISRLAGLERVATARAGGIAHQPNVAVTSGGGAYGASGNPGGYFDGSGPKERDTVGSASATGSVGNRTTWASGSDAFDADKMSEDPDDRASDVSDISDEGNASLVGFGEGASTISGPTSASSMSVQPGSTPTMSLNRSLSGDRPSSLGSAGAVRTFPHPQQQQLGAPMSLSPTPGPMQDARMVDGMTYDSDVVDTTMRTPRLATPSGRDEIV